MRTGKYDPVLPPVPNQDAPSLYLTCLVVMSYSIAPGIDAAGGRVEVVTTGRDIPKRFPSALFISGVPVTVALSHVLPIPVVNVGTPAPEASPK